MGVLYTVLVLACVYDYRQGRIPNMLLLIGMAAGGIRGGTSGWTGVARYLYPGVVTLLILYPLFRIGAIGAGDIKLLSICVGYFPYQKIIYFLFFSMLISAVISVFKMYREQNMRERLTYLWEYIRAVAATGHWSLYLDNSIDREKTGICLSGPILGSVLLYWGGVY